MVWENKNESCAMTVDRVRVMMEEWQLATANRSTSAQQNVHLQASAATAQQIVHLQASDATAQQPPAHLQQLPMAAAHSATWQRPSHGPLKCNVDAGFSTAKNRTVIDICVQDDHGAYVLAKAISFDIVHTVRVGKALGLYHALEWLSDMQFDNVDFATNSKITYDAFHSHKDDVSEFGHII